MSSHLPLFLLILPRWWPRRRRVPIRIVRLTRLLQLHIIISTPVIILARSISGWGIVGLLFSLWCAVVRLLVVGDGAVAASCPSGAVVGGVALSSSAASGDATTNTLLVRWLDDVFVSGTYEQRKKRKSAARMTRPRTTHRPHAYHPL